ncbi:MAG: hypothetical protein GX435_09330 [Exilispira sp.]|nr:hypothetical protein [Exilispira sp.]
MDIRFFDGPLYENFYNEWILTNYKGGFALGFGNLINERKYDGVLTAGEKDLTRNHLVSSIEEKVFINNSSFYLDSNNYLDLIYPYGYRHLVKSYMRPFPSFLYSSYPFDPNILILKSIFMHPDKNVSVVCYTNLSYQTISLELRPKYSCRFYHALNSPGTIDNINYILDINYFGNNAEEEIYFRRLDNDIEVFCYVIPDKNVLPSKILDYKVIYHNIYYTREAEKGYDAIEDLFSPYIVYKNLKIGETFSLLFSDCKIEVNKSNIDSSLDNLCNITKNTFNSYITLPLALDHPFKIHLPEFFKDNLKNNEENSNSMYNNNQKNLIDKNDMDNLSSTKNIDDLEKEKTTNYTDYNKIYSTINFEDIDLYSYEEYREILKLAMLDFKIDNDIIAGYPWFTCWGRDTMITLEAFLPSSGIEKDFSFAYNILINYSSRIKDGIIPNAIFENSKPIYNTIDASLWLIMRAYDLWPFLPKNKRRELFNIISEIVLNYYFNRSLPFFRGEDGLLQIKKDDSQALTWMDVVINGKAVTPRYGAPIEVNGLWYNTFCILEKIMDDLKLKNIKNSSYHLHLDQIIEEKDKIIASMQNFYVDGIWIDRLYDQLSYNEIRPNFVIALGLPFDFTSSDKLEKGYELAKNELLTPYGLRTLSSKSPLFKKKYVGSQLARDMAYHQGTVWPWLLLPYCKLVLKVTKEKAVCKKELEDCIFRLRNGFIKNHKASVAEVWDGMDPHLSKGCPAQAWSVAALYLIERLIDKLK